jgi:hypothetical protein
MDTALFYPGRLNLSPQEAWEKLTPILASAARYGGVLTINWHDRSIAPERLWGDFYIRLLDWLENRGSWFSTATQAVCWFQRRRKVTFDKVERDGSSLHVKVSVPPDEGLPPMRLRIYLPRGPAQLGRSDDKGEDCYRDFCLNSDIDFRIS